MKDMFKSITTLLVYRRQAVTYCRGTILIVMCALLLPVSHVWGQWPSTVTVFDDPDPTRPVESLGLTHRDGRHWFVAEIWDNSAQTGQVYVKRHIPGLGFTARSNVGNDPYGADRLTTTDRHTLPSIAIDANTGLNVSMQTDVSGYGPTIENVTVFPGSLAPVVNPPHLIDDDNGLIEDRGRSWIAINDTLGDVWSCWTYHTPTDDDVYCRGRLTGLANLVWTEPILPLATTPMVTEDHPSVAIQTTTARRVVAYHSDTGIKVRLFDTSNTEDLPNDVSLGGTTQVDFPHLIDANGVLHVVALHKADEEIKYATCSADCHIDANWSRETIDDINAGGDSLAHPQVAVDDAGNVFVAFQHIPAGLGNVDERVKVTAKCATDGWDNDGGELIDGTQGREQIGGHTVFKALPAFVYDDTNDRLGVTYVQGVGGVDRIGRWARKDAPLAFSDICAGQ